LKTENIFLGLGSNLGDKEKNILTAIEEIKKIAEVKKVSDFYKSKAWGKTDQPDFANAVMEISTDIEPDELLKKLKGIEKKLGRIDREKWGPREIDIDILFWDQEIINTKDLTIPHPHWNERDFVTIPIKQIAPNFQPPIL